MVPEEYSEHFMETFYGNPVTIHTRIQVEQQDEESQGIGVLSYSGILIDVDQFFFYLGYNPKDVAIAINVDDVTNITLFHESTDLNVEPGSGVLQ